MQDTFYTVNHVTGAATPVGVIGSDLGAVADVAVDPTTGTVYGISTCGSLHTINPATGAGTILPNPPGVACIEGIVFDAAGVLYGVSETRDGFFVIDKNTGAVTATLVGPPLVTEDGVGLAIDAAGTVYSVTSTRFLQTINPATGALLSSVAISDPSGLGRKVTDIAFGNNGVLYGVAKLSGKGTVSDLVTLNPATGAIISTIGSTGANLAGLGHGNCPP
jgi:outer membrane protein assembly factor BamB